MGLLEIEPTDHIEGTAPAHLGSDPSRGRPGMGTRYRHLVAAQMMHALCGNVNV